MYPNCRSPCMLTTIYCTHCIFPPCKYLNFNFSICNYGHFDYRNHLLPFKLSFSWKKKKIPKTYSMNYFPSSLTHTHTKKRKINQLSFIGVTQRSNPATQGKNQQSHKDQKAKKHILILVLLLQVSHQPLFRSAMPVRLLLPHRYRRPPQHTTHNRIQAMNDESQWYSTHT